MAKARDTQLRHDILTAFDNKSICTIEDIREHVNKPDHTVRYTVKAMLNEGLIKVFKRGEHNRAYYVKEMFPNTTVLTSLTGNPVGLMQFIGELDQLNTHPVINDTALEFMKLWMLNAIATADKQAYTDKKRPIPVAKELKSNLEELRSAIELLHRYVKTFLDTDMWSDAAQERLKKELDGIGITSVLVDRYPL
jgi:hypothetical protein